MEAVGIRGQALDYLRSYLANRQQYVSVRGQHNGVLQEFKSPSRNISRGIPQGSILGPTLFLIYVCDMPDVLSRCLLYQYADDTSCLISESNLANLSQYGNDINISISSWCKNNQLDLNVKKTATIYFNSKGGESIYFNLNGKSIPNVNNFKFLGMNFDNSMSWEVQIDELVKKLNSVFFAIRNLRNFVNVEVMKTYYYGHVYSRIKYCILVWGASTKSIRVFRAQKRIVRCMLKKPTNTPCRPLFQMLNILPLPAIYLFELGVWARQNLRNLDRNSTFYNNMITRGADNLCIPSHKTALFEKAPEYRAIKVYNKLPEDIKVHACFNKYRQALRNFLIDKCFYSYDEFLSAN